MMFRAVNKLLLRLLDVCATQKMDDQKQFVIYASKISFLEDIIVGAFRADKRSIFYKELYHRDWQNLLSHYECYRPVDSKDFLEKINFMYYLIAAFAAGLSRGL